MNNAFDAGVRFGIEKVASEDKEAFIRPLMKGARGLVNQAKPLAFNAAIPLQNAAAAMQGGAMTGGMAGALAGGASSLIGTGGRAMAASASPLAQRFGRVMGVASPVVGALA